ncbi:MAG: ArsR/SmtB family transcription factor [Hyphomicrobiaceae bacterium]
MLTPMKDPAIHRSEESAPLPADGGDRFQAMRAAALEAAKLLRAIGSPRRLMILCLLMEGEKTVTQISDAIGARQSLTSQHLTHLRLHRLVQVERRGHYAYYSLAETVARDIVATLHRHYCAG